MRLNLLFRSNEPNNSKRHKLHAYGKMAVMGLFLLTKPSLSRGLPTTTIPRAGMGLDQ